MSENVLIGYTGLVGSNIINQKNDINIFINSKNYTSIINSEYSTIYCCGISANKYWANLNGEEDLNNINELINVLKTIKCKKFILISTIDVYNKINGDINENSSDYLNNNNHNYGKHRLYFENFVKNTFEDYNIVRLPGLIGYGLKKNVIYDLLYDNNPTFNIKSSFQWYHLDHITNDIEYAIKNNIRELNLFTEPCTMGEILQFFNSDVKYNISENIINYDLKTAYGYNGYWNNKTTVLNYIKRFINLSLDNKLVLSNLAYDIEPISILKKYNIKHTEVVPYKTFGKDFIEKELTYFDKWKNKDIYSFQSILYPLNDNILLLFEYIKKIIEIGNHIGIKRLVFGSPKNRKAIDTDENKFIEFMIDIGNYCKQYDIIFCIEPNSKEYGCDFITNSVEGRCMVNKINHPNIKLHLDIGCMLLENENVLDSILDNFDILEHIHFSAKHLKKLTNDNISYAWLYNELLKNNYSKMISIEMLNQNDDDIDFSIYNILRIPKIKIIGGGWYGCHTASEYKINGNIVNLFEKNNNIFCESSGKNQNRLHLGFHYPRSYNTRKLCLEGYQKFIDKYEFCTFKIKNNYYAVSNESNIDYKTFTDIMEKTNIEFEIIDNHNINNVEGIIKVQERVIDNNIAKMYFKLFLNNNLYYNNTISNIHDENYDYIYNCTNNVYNQILKNEVKYEKTISLLLKLNNNDNAYTVMDGDFISLYPYDYTNCIYTLTHVKYTPLISSNFIEEVLNFNLTEDKLKSIKSLMLNDMHKYLQLNENDYTVIDYFTSIKCKYLNSSDSRDIVVHRNNNIYSMFCGKITGIFKIPL